MDQDLQWIISVDDHIIEPPDLWVSRASAARSGSSTRMSSVAMALTPGSTRTSDRPSWGSSSRLISRPTITHRFPSTTTRCRSRTTTRWLGSRTWTRTMSSPQLNFPFFPRFCGQAFAEARDKELALKCLRVVQRLRHRRVVRGGPGALHPAGHRARCGTRTWPSKRSIAVRTRAAKAIAFSENLHPLGLAVDPLRRVGQLLRCRRRDRHAAVHPHRLLFGDAHHAPDAPFGVSAVNINLNLANSTTDWLFSGKLQQHPESQDRALRGRDRLDPLRARACRARRHAIPVPPRQQLEL